MGYSFEQKIAVCAKTGRSRAGGSGKFVNRQGRHCQWPASTAGCPAILRAATKGKLIDELARLMLISKRLKGASKASPNARTERARTMRMKQDARIEGRIAALQQIIVEYAQQRRVIEPGLYADVARRMVELTKDKFSPATLYIEPYRTVLRGKDPEWTDEVTRVRRRLQRHTRKRLMQLIAIELKTIEHLTRTREQRLASQSLSSKAIEQFAEHFPGRWLEKAATTSAASQL